MPVPKTIIAAPQSFAPTVNTHYFLPTARNNVPEIRHILWTLTVNDGWIGANKFMWNGYDNWMQTR